MKWNKVVKNYLKFKTSRLKVLFVSLSILALLCAITPTRNFILKYSVIAYARLYGVEFSCSNLSITSKVMTFKNAKLIYIHNVLESELLEIDYNLRDAIFRRKTGFKIHSDKLEINNSAHLTYTSSGTYNLRRGYFDLKQNIESSFVKQNKAGIDKISLDSDIAYSDHGVNITSLNAKVKDGSINCSGYVKYNDAGLGDIVLDSHISQIPLTLYEILLSQQNPVYEFLEDSITSGNIESGHFGINIQEDLSNTASIDLSRFMEALSDKNIKGDFLVKDVSYKYAKDAPVAFSKNLPIKIRGKDISVDLKGATIAGSVVGNGSVEFNYLEPSITYNIKAYAEGPAKGLLVFAHKDTLDELKKFNIDLQQASGIAKSDIKIVVPSGASSKVIYDIAAKIPNFELAILDNNINATKYSLEGKFDGAKIEIKGKGLMNNHKSETSLLLNLYETNDYWCSLDSKIYLEPNDLEKSNYFVVKGGNAQLNVSYRLDKDEKSSLKASSNLTNANFYLPTITLDKQIGKKALFTLESKEMKGADQMFAFKLSGEDGLLISGNSISTDDSMNVEFDNVKYFNNNFKASIKMAKDKTFAKINGGLLDLSQTDLSSYFSNSNSKPSAFRVNIMLDTVKLKNNVNFTETMLDLECTPKECNNLQFRSSMDGVNYVALHYDRASAKHYYKLETNNAGLFLAGLGITNKISKGMLIGSMEAPLTKENEANYRSNGKFVITKLATTQNKFLAKMISVISIPGLLGSLSNSDIPFNVITSDIEYEKNQLKFRNLKAEGIYFSFYAKTDVDFKDRSIHVAGGVIPSLYSINTLVGSLPVIKYMFGNRGGIVVTPFSFDDKY